MFKNLFWGIRAVVSVIDNVLGGFYFLQIGKNPIGDGGVETLLNVIKAHRAIKFLSLEVCSCSFDLKEWSN